MALKCKRCCDLEGRSCRTCGRGTPFTTKRPVQCALCDGRDHVSRYCPQTVVGLERIRKATAARAEA